MNSDENRFNTLSKQIEKTSVCDVVTMQELSKQQFKEDYYINQQSNDTTLVLTVFGVTVVFFGLFSYALFESRINEHKNYYANKIEEQDRKYSVYKTHLDDLLKSIASDKGYENKIKANESYVKNEYDWFIYYTFEAVSDFSDYFVIVKKEQFSEELQSLIITNQITFLQDVLIKIEGIQDINDFEPSVTNDYVTKIKRFKSIEIDKMIAKLYSKLLD